MPSFDVKFSLIKGRPIMERTTNGKQYTALFDTGAIVPVLNMPKYLILSMGGKKVSDEIFPIGGFGIESDKATLYEFKEWYFEDITFYDFRCYALNEHRTDLHSMIIPSGILDGTKYTIDTIASVMTVDYPNSFDLKRRFISSKTVTGYVAFTQSDLQSTEVLGNTYVNVLVANIIVHSAVIKNKSLINTLNKFDEVKREFKRTQKNADIVIVVTYSDFKDLFRICRF